MAGDPKPLALDWYGVRFPAPTDSAVTRASVMESEFPHERTSLAGAKKYAQALSKEKRLVELWRSAHSPLGKKLIAVYFYGRYGGRNA